MRRLYVSWVQKAETNCHLMRGGLQRERWVTKKKLKKSWIPRQAIGLHSGWASNPLVFFRVLFGPWASIWRALFFGVEHFDMCMTAGRHAKMNVCENPMSQGEKSSRAARSTVVSVNGGNYLALKRLSAKPPSTCAYFGIQGCTKRDKFLMGE